MTVKVEAFLAIEDSLTARLQKTYTRLARGYERAVQAAMAEGDVLKAQAVAESIDMTPVYTENESFIRMQTYASLTFGATRLTPEPKDTSVSTGIYSGLVNRMMKKLKAEIVGTFTQRVQDMMVQLIAQEGAGETVDELVVQKYNENQPREPKGSPIGGRFKGGGGGTGRTLYHVTLTSRVEAIQEKGLLPMQTSNWIQAGSGQRYGAGEVYAFESKKDAIRWAARWDWQLNKATGTGDVSILEVDSDPDDWQVDENDPLSQAGGEGRWFKRMARIPPEFIGKPSKVTAEAIRSIVMVAKYDKNQPRDPKGSPTGGQWTSQYASSADNPDGLPMDQASRLERARQQGFDTSRVLYHGSKQDINEFKPGYDDGLIFLTTNPEFAAKWIHGTGGLRTRTTGPSGELWADQEYDALRERMRPLRANYPEGDDGDTAYYDMVYAERAKLVSASAVDSAVYPVYLRVHPEQIFDPRTQWAEIEDTLREIGRKRLRETGEDQGWDKLIAEGRHKEGNWIIYERKEVVRALNGMGYNAMWIRESALQDAPTETIAVFDPSDIRSVNAVFDPKHQFSKNILKYDENQLRDSRGRWATMWHLTDNPQFALDSARTPEKNTSMGLGVKPGLFVAKDLEPWVNGYDYVRPFAVELKVPLDLSTPDPGMYGGERFIPAERFGDVEVSRVIPLDAYAREVYNDYGWLESWRDSPPMGQKPPERWYTGPDVRVMPKKQQRAYIQLAQEYLRANRPWVLDEQE